MNRILKFTGAAALAFLVLLELTWWIAVPSADKLARAAERFVNAGNNVDLTIDSPSKGVFFGIGADRATMSFNGRYDILFEKPGFYPDIASLFKGAPGIVFNAGLLGGTAKGEVGITTLSNSAPRLSIDVGRVDIASMLEFAGLAGSGILYIEGGQAGGLGEFKLRITDLMLKPEGIAALIPVENFRGVNGMLITSGSTVSLKGLEIEGEGLHARMKGKVIGERLDLTLELFVDAETVKENSLILAGIERFKASPGHYSFPVRGTLSNPVIR